MPDLSYLSDFGATLQQAFQVSVGKQDDASGIHFPRKESILHRIRQTGFLLEVRVAATGNPSTC
ncbi:MAG: hypothetical protein CMI00_01960 [Oceanospirillaceae bacterium]|nr:hypothetical protein [Oceanospirillaceae bacterium]|tara:strand:- start:1319 stop:1510 length:192 start_codon:yes stop_codon:yes gene_type:complete